MKEMETPEELEQRRQKARERLVNAPRVEAYTVDENPTQYKLT